MNDSTIGSGTVPTTTGSDIAAVGPDEQRSLKAYVSDLLALERHISEPISRQKDDADVRTFTEAYGFVSSLDALVKRHITDLEALLEELGGHAASPVKSLWSGLLGGAASVIDNARRTEVSKDLRDDYTAISLATVSYSMLHATALGYGEATIAQLAKRGLEDYARSVMELGRIIPGVVIDELAGDGMNVAPEAREQARASIEESWRSQSRSAHGGSF
jgi:ferritin-like metal-binding protein YciE